MGASIETSSGRYLRSEMNMSALMSLLSIISLQPVNRCNGSFHAMIGLNSVGAVSINPPEFCGCAFGLILSVRMGSTQRESDSTRDGQLLKTAVRTCSISEYIVLVDRGWRVPREEMVLDRRLRSRSVLM